jgi:hypothetical protein
VINGTKLRIFGKPGPLLLFLGTARGPGRDGLVDFKSADDIVLWLEKLVTRPITPQSVANLVYRLRNALEDRGFCRSIIENRRGVGWRLRMPLGQPFTPYLMDGQVIWGCRNTTDQ